MLGKSVQADSVSFTCLEIDLRNCDLGNGGVANFSYPHPSLCPLWDIKLIFF